MEKKAGFYHDPLLNNKLIDKKPVFVLDFNNLKKFQPQRTGIIF